MASEPGLIRFAAGVIARDPIPRAGRRASSSGGSARPPLPRRVPVKQYSGTTGAHDEFHAHYNNGATPSSVSF